MKSSVIAACPIYQDIVYSTAVTKEDQSEVKHEQLSL